MLSKEESDRELERINSEGVVVVLSEYKIKTLWNQVCQNLEMPKIEVDLFKNECVEQLRDFLRKVSSKQGRKRHDEHVKQEYNLEE